ncbi:MAG: hypothetical protein K1000chlam4_00343 [Chlamydiae bacterium]|nr:hypothetical protein [Chlamydiota bacterium]
MEHFSWWFLVQPLVTITVGSVAWLIYYLQKRDKKREAAAIILMEIRLAEKRIEEIKRSKRINPNIFSPLLISTRWNEYNHFFVNNLDKDEMDAIDNFYNDCITIDRSIEQRSASKQLEQKSQAFHATLSKLAVKATDQDNFEQEKNKYIKIIVPDKALLSADLPQQIIQDIINNITPITNSNIGYKLKKIASYE